MKVIASLIATACTFLIGGVLLLTAIFYLRTDSAWWPLPGAFCAVCGWSLWVRRDDAQ